MLVDVEVGFGWLVLTMLDLSLPLVGWEWLFLFSRSSCLTDYAVANCDRHLGFYTPTLTVFTLLFSFLLLPFLPSFPESAKPKPSLLMPCDRKVLFFLGLFLLFLMGSVTGGLVRSLGLNLTDYYPNTAALALRILIPKIFSLLRWKTSNGRISDIRRVSLVSE